MERRGYHNNEYTTRTQSGDAQKAAMEVGSLLSDRGGEGSMPKFVKQ